MQGRDDDDVDRWFGVFRSLGTEDMGAARYQGVCRGRRRRVAEIMLAAVVAIAIYALFQWVTARPAARFVDAVFDVGLLVLLPTVVYVLRPLWALSGIRRDGVVEHFEGRAPVIQGHRDHLTDQLVSQGLVGTTGVHRLTVDRDTGVLLEVDGAPVELQLGKVVTTARVPEAAAGAASSMGERRPLTLTEAEELEAITSRRTHYRWALAVAYTAVYLPGSSCLVFSLPSRLFFIAAPTALVLLLVSLVWTRRVVRESDRASRARVRADIVGGLVRRTTTWYLPATDILWERDGAPGFKRLERGGLAGHERYEARPQTF